jgi:hypothetical protein
MDSKQVEAHIQWLACIGNLGNTGMTGRTSMLRNSLLALKNIVTLVADDYEVADTGVVVPVA